ncbi:MAG: Arm DNA-binding domain-containing protein, partial [Bacteroidota bacterium]
MSVTTAIILDKRRMSKKTKNYPVVLRVTFNRDPRLFSLGVYLSAQDFEKLSSPRLGIKLREIKEKLEKEEQRAKTIIKNLRNFSFPAFSDEFFAFSAHARKRSTKAAPQAPADLKGVDPDSGTDVPVANRPNGIRRKNFKN